MFKSMKMELCFKNTDILQQLEVLNEYRLQKAIRFLLLATKVLEVIVVLIYVSYYYYSLSQF